MSLEKPVVRAIRRYRRRVLLARASVALALPLLSALVLVFIVVPYALGNTTFSPLITKAGGATWVIVAAVVAALLVAAALVLYLPGLFRDGDYFDTLTSAARGFEAPALARFIRALESFSNEAGVDFPKLRVIKGDCPNALAFEGENSPVVGVTKGALESKLTDADVESIMAREVACIITGDYLKRPDMHSFEAPVFLLLCVYAALALVAIPMTTAGRGKSFGLVVACVLLFVLLLASFFLQKSRGTRSRDDLLADSIAGKITGDPGSLARTIKKVDGIVNGSGRAPLPENRLGLEYMFVRPCRWGETPEVFLDRKNRELDLRWSDRSIAGRVEGLRRDLGELSEKCSLLLDARIENLEAAGRGQWKAFE